MPRTTARFVPAPPLPPTDDIARETAGRGRRAGRRTAADTATRQVDGQPRPEAEHVFKRVIFVNFYPSQRLWKENGPVVVHRLTS